MQTIQDILDAVKFLNSDERLRLAEAIWDDVPVENWPLPSTEWISEAQRRSKLFEEGKSHAKSWSEVKLDARRKAGLDG